MISPLSDILEDLKRDYYDEVNVLQDTQSFAYEQGFLPVGKNKIAGDAKR